MESQVIILNSNEINLDALRLIEMIKNQSSLYLQTSHNPDKLMDIVAKTTPAEVKWRHVSKENDSYVLFIERKGSCCGVCQGH
ncbi:MAG: hypothetical protein R3A80_03705 [Bdellovibrionota bacterium]